MKLTTCKKCGRENLNADLDTDALFSGKVGDERKRVIADFDHELSCQQSGKSAGSRVDAERNLNTVDHHERCGSVRPKPEPVKKPEPEPIVVATPPAPARTDAPKEKPKRRRRGRS